jgi:hypothetical protein
MFEHNFGGKTEMSRTMFPRRSYPYHHPGDHLQLSLKIDLIIVQIRKIFGHDMSDDHGPMSFFPFIYFVLSKYDSNSSIIENCSADTVAYNYLKISGKRKPENQTLYKLYNDDVIKKVENFAVEILKKRKKELSQDFAEKLRSKRI